MKELQTIISRTGTRHIVGIPRGETSIKTHICRVTTYCGFGVRGEEALIEAVRDCQFCRSELEKEPRWQPAESNINANENEPEESGSQTGHIKSEEKPLSNELFGNRG
jgi:hypothetical protein